MRRAQNADTHALKQHRLSQNSSSFCFSFLLVIASDMQIEPESENLVKNTDFRPAKNVQKQATFFFWGGGGRGEGVYFLTNSYNLTRTLYPVVRPVVQKVHTEVAVYDAAPTFYFSDRSTSRNYYDARSNLALFELRLPFIHIKVGLLRWDTAGADIKVLRVGYP